MAPQLPQYDSQVPPPGPVQQPLARSWDTMTGQFTAQFGQGLENLGAGLSAYSAQKQSYESQKLAAEAQGQWADQLEQMKKSAPPGAPNFTQNVMTQYDAWRDKTLESASGGQARRSLEISLQQLRNNLLNNATQFEASSYANQQAIDLNSLFQSNENRVLANPSLVKPTLQSEIQLIHKTPFWNQQHQNDVIQKRSYALWDSALDGTVRRLESDPLRTQAQAQQLLQTLTDDKQPWIGATSSKNYEDALRRVYTLQKQLGASELTEMSKDFKDNMDRLERTGENPSPYNRAWIEKNVPNPTLKQKMLDRYQEALAVGTVSKMMENMPEPEVESYLKQLDENYPKTSQPGLTFSTLDAARKAYANRLKVYREDPVDYIFSVDKGIQTIFLNYLTNPSPQAAENYAKTMIDKQKFLSPNSSITYLLPKDEAWRTFGLLKTLPDTPDGASKAQGILQDQVTTWGKYWPYIVNDLRNRKILNDERYVAATMVDKPQYKYFSEDLLRIAFASKQQLSQLIDQKEEGSAITRSNQASILALSDLRQTLQWGEKGPENLQIYQSFQKALAKYLLYKGAWKGAFDSNLKSEAVTYANIMVNDKYNFVGTYRVPKSEDIQSIKYGATLAMAKIPQLDLALPSSEQGLKPEDVKKLYINKIMSKGFWVTNGDESGVTLFMPNDLKNKDTSINAFPVTHYINGHPFPVKFSWDDLKNLTIESNKQFQKLRNSLQQ